MFLISYLVVPILHFTSQFVKEKVFKQDPMPHFPSWCLPTGEREINFSLSNKTNNVGTESGSPTENGSEAKPFGLQLMDHHGSSPTPSAGHSFRPHQDASAGGGVNSQDQSYSSESGQDEICERRINHAQTKPVLLSSPNTTSDHVHHPLVQLPYDPYLAGLLTAYGPNANMGMGMGMSSTRVALPANLTEDGAIYVNAKQYHGILRRRQSRARLEAQNKLVKTRKPYLHESRHLHALNRVRGTGGRFVSTKKSPPPNMSSHGSGGDITSVSNNGSMYLNSDRTGLRVSGSVNSAVQRTGGLMFGSVR